MTSLQDLLRSASRRFAIGIEELAGVLCDAGAVACCCAFRTTWKIMKISALKAAEKS